ncbi:GNAT family acetyltransferase [Sphingosinicella sp. BN140058]|nr:GNAT family acetyltransferase [Sphingosinicella sp. BN140058]
MAITHYQDHHFNGVDSLWQEAFPNDPPHNRAEIAIPAKLAVQPELFLVAEDAGNVVGTVMAGYDGHRGWLYSVAVRLSHRGTGVASEMISAAEIRLAALGCTKVNLQVRAENEAVAHFYARLGYESEPRISMGKRLNPAA